MPNEPKPAREKRSPPARRPNAQDDPEGSAHSPDEFDALNPAKQVPGVAGAPPRDGQGG